MTTKYGRACIFLLFADSTFRGIGEGANRSLQTTTPVALRVDFFFFLESNDVNIDWLKTLLHVISVLGKICSVSCRRRCCCSCFSIFNWRKQLTLDCVLSLQCLSIPFPIPIIVCSHCIYAIIITTISQRHGIQNVANWNVYQSSSESVCVGGRCATWKWRKIRFSLIKDR